MKFTGFFAAALAFGTALAAPAHSVSDVQALQKRSECSQNSGCALNTVLTTVEHLKATVKSEIELITTTVSGANGNDQDVVPIIKVALTTITGEIQVVTGELLPLVLGLGDKLTKAELSLVLEILADLKVIVGDVKGCVTDLTANLSVEILLEIELEIKALLGCLGPLVTPVLTLVFGLVGKLGIHVTGLLKQVLTIAIGLKVTLSEILAPVTGLVGCLLGKVLGQAL
ncbi:hypothetical protein SODALDRAFT_347389 [Sodiomyces alkalinus F11]|uniref:Uncharacterized protein n=1 Tax=Sodiomyces alkalinus (strain CBS 110278 / VKM F-3762 / F11) TaxID=1314773 RepID=A0A3N2QB63_SODAK|nr:hypothetical protein SODALDRAFT_347389 [Sodiomyces alkalinus F11]ROT43838.1 hypothetical protein SODALDRAFT_347389 [Sodiomyces alkalinus F11]